ncbi:methylamine utilization protein [Sphingomonas ginkgonis]|uniref:Methylamine utilization protein n=1 Tax=Sphingomonas ginkgonis TaxID=2315330 RepID=A0A429VCP4_9SPHN|nr:methylamine utilization protein [Sphingomonas ginkgonis]RST31750.1 methylamine utilization protein [Sphingomonas ginkgonis]
MLSSASAQAAPLLIRVVDPAGHPVRDAVVSVLPASGARPMRITQRYQVSQRGLQFHPFVSVVPAGAEVSFPNFDPTKHHVYSFSQARSFELKLFARDQSRTVRFDRPGVVALGCNIHDRMSAFIAVAASNWTAVTGPDGTIRFADLPGGPARLSVWHPYLRAPGNQVDQALGPNVPAVKVMVRLRPPPMHAMADY